MSWPSFRNGLPSDDIEAKRILRARIRRPPDDRGRTPVDNLIENDLLDKFVDLLLNVYKRDSGNLTFCEHAMPPHPTVYSGFATLWFTASLSRLA